MTDIFCHCIECSKENGKYVEVEAKKVSISNNMWIFDLACGHQIVDTSGAVV